MAMSSFVIAADQMIINFSIKIYYHLVAAERVKSVKLGQLGTLSLLVS